MRVCGEITCKFKNINYLLNVVYYLVKILRLTLTMTVVKLQLIWRKGQDPSRYTVKEI